MGSKINLPNVDFSRISSNSNDAKSKIFLDKNNILTEYWDDELTYEPQGDGTYLISKDNVAMGYTDEEGYNNAVKIATEIYGNWRQNNSEWAKETLGNTDLTIEAAGCALTSMAILLAKSGVDTSSIEGNLNPLTLRNALFESLTRNFGKLEWGAISQLFPEFQYQQELSNFNTYNSEEDYRNIKQLVNDGYEIEIQICDREKSGGLTHYVAVDRIENGEIYVFDPAYDGEGSIPLSSIKWRDVEDLGIYAYQVYEVKK